MCLVSFLTLEPEYQESKDAHAEIITALSSVKKAFFELGQPFTFVWVNAISHGQQLIKDFGVRYFHELIVAICFLLWLQSMEIRRCIKI